MRSIITLGLIIKLIAGIPGVISAEAKDGIDTGEFFFVTALSTLLVLLVDTYF